MSVTAFLVLALAAIAAVVFAGQVRKKNMWLWICAYWLVLTVKNLLDLVGSR